MHSLCTGPLQQFGIHRNVLTALLNVYVLLLSSG